MRVALTERFQRDLRHMQKEQRLLVFEVILSLPVALGRPHDHGGIGVRKIHPSGIWEARVGLGLRMIFGFLDDVLTLDRVGTHDEIRRYLKSL